MAWYGGEDAPVKAAQASVMQDQAPGARIAATTQLRNGLDYPLVGLGCASGVREAHVLSALQQGYRLLDTAAAFEWGYREDEVGRALACSGLRQQVFVQTKVRTLPGVDVRGAVKACMARLQLEQLDAVLIHKPEGDWLAAWAVLEELYREGVVRAIGASDLGVDKLERLVAAAQERPMILQNWFEPFHQDVAVRSMCKQLGIIYQSFSLLGTQWRMILKLPRNPVLAHPTLLAIAARHKRSVPQVLLRWALAEGVAAVPASRSEEHRQENLQAQDFELTEDELNTIRKLDGSTPVAA